MLRFVSNLVTVCVSKIFNSRLFIIVLIILLCLSGEVSVVVSGIRICVMIENKLVNVVLRIIIVSD